MLSPLRCCLLLLGAAGLACGAAASDSGTSGDPSSSGGVSPSSSGSFGGTTTSDEPQSTSSTGADGSDSGSGLPPTDTESSDEITCDSYLQDCPEGEKCNPYADDGSSVWNALGCFPVAPSQSRPGDPCGVVGGVASGYDNCALGSMCWGVDPETDIGTCVALCEGSADAPICRDRSTVCSIANRDVLNLCLLSCELGSDDCPEGQACYETNNGSVCGPEAAPPPGAPGTSCDNIASCDVGAICVTAAAHGPGCEGQGCCTQECELSDPMCDNPNQVCQEWFEEGMVPPGLEDYGVCMVPV